MLNHNKFLVAIISAAILLFSLISCSDDDPVSPQQEHFEPEGWVFVDATSARFMTIWQGKFDAGSANKFTVKIDELTDHIEVKFLDKNKTEIDPPDEGDYSFSFSIADTNIVQIHQHDAGEYEFHLKGISAGTTEIEFFVMHLDHVDVRTIKIPVEVN